MKLEDIISQIKHERSIKKISLLEISNIIKIPVSMLKNIEQQKTNNQNNNFFFYKHVLAYAKFLGINTDKFEVPKLQYIPNHSQYYLRKNFNPSKLQLTIALIIIMILL